MSHVELWLGRRSVAETGSAQAHTKRTRATISMGISTLTETYGGAFTADARLILKEEEPHSVSEPDCPPAKRPRGEIEHATGKSALSCSMQVHPAVLWPCSEYFISKVRQEDCLKLQLLSCLMCTMCRVQHRTVTVNNQIVSERFFFECSSVFES